MQLDLNWNLLELLCAGVSICVVSLRDVRHCVSVCVCVCVCVCVRSSRQLLASDHGGVLFVTRTGLSPPPGVGITMIVMAMECEWQAGSHVVAGEQEDRTAPVPDISLSFIKTLHSFLTTHSLCSKISLIYFFFPPFSLSCQDPSFSLFFYLSTSMLLIFFILHPHFCLCLSLSHLSFFLTLFLQLKVCFSYSLDITLHSRLYERFVRVNFRTGCIISNLHTQTNNMKLSSESWCVCVCNPF